MRFVSTIGTRRGAALVGGACAVLLAASACGSSGKTTAAPSGSTGAADVAPATVTVGQIGTPGEVPAVDFANTKYYPGIDSTFKTKITTKYFTSPVSAYAALLAGQLDFLDAAPSTMLTLKAKGQGSDLVALDSIAQGGGAVFLAPIKNKSKGTGLSAIKSYGSSTWGVASLGGVGQYFIDLALSSQGITPSKVPLTTLGSAGTVPAVTSGKVDIVPAAVTQAAPLVESGKAYYVWFTSSTEAYQQFGYTPEDALVSTTGFTAKYPQFTQAIVGAQVQSVQFFQQNVNSPATVYQALAPAAQQLITQAQFTTIWPIIRAVSVPTTGLLTVAEMQTYTKSLQKFGFLPSTYTFPADAVDPTYLLGAYKALGLPAPTGPLNSAFTDVMSSSEVGIGA